MDLRVAAYAVITDDAGRLLLARWSEGLRPAWTLPGGGIESGEDPRDAARREVYEETGYRVRIGRLLGVHSRVIPASRRVQDGGRGPLQALRIVFRAEIVGGTLRSEVDGSTDRAEWFARDRVRGLQRVKLVDIALRMDAEDAARE